MKLVNGRRVGRLSSPELGTVLSLRKDGTVQSALIKASDKKTLTQTYQRLKMPNLGSFYKQAKVALEKAFEGSNLNVFAELVRYNITSDKKPVGITRSQKRNGACVAMPYKITDGELRSIVVNGQISDVIVSSELQEITKDTTIGALADAIVNGNPGRFQYDDKIFFIQVAQLRNGQMPTVSVSYACLTLIKDSQEKLGEDFFMKGFAIDGEHLAVKGTPAVGCFAWIHTRKDADGNLMLSSQELVSNNEAFIELFTRPEALQAAAKSYDVDMASMAALEPVTAGERMIHEAFGFKLKPAQSSVTSTAAEGQILSVTYDGKNYTEGDAAPIMDVSVSDQVIVNVSDITLLGNTIQCKINGSPVQNPVKSGNTIKMTIPADQDANPLRTVVVLDPTHAWRLEF